MIKSKYKVVGVMSGTSLDGLDLAYIEFNFEDKWNFSIIEAETIAYSNEWNQILKNLVSNSIEDLNEIDENYTSYLASIINDFVYRNCISDINAVCSHGHTALHQPENKLTYQIGNLKKLSSLVEKTVVCDFRVQDVEFGGQGAPLVPIGDELLFSDYDFCLNLGGFANVSTKTNSTRIAYDICPVNIVLNRYVSKLGYDFDDSGKIASTGKMNPELLSELNGLDFYNLNPPKSLGLEWVRDIVFPIIDNYNLSVEDILRTFIEHCAFQISRETGKKEDAFILITGGGVYNSFLIERLKTFTNNKIVIPDKNLIEFKEALIFGLLGVLKLRGEINCLRSVTGAKKDHSSGQIYYP
jgi:anhydro-N-acetylmuramic acid kinase